MNSNELASSSNVFYKIDAKTLQLKWTDIEIRRHVIPTLSKEEKSDSVEDDEEELPPLLEKPSPEVMEQEKKAR